MKDDGKIIRLTGYLLFSVIGFLLSIVVLFLLIRLFFGLLSYIPWITYTYTIFIISVPASVFISVFLIYFRRTASHPKTSIRLISYGIFLLFLATWICVYIVDMIAFFRNEKSEIEYYFSYNTLFLTCNVVIIFFTGVIQAFTQPKEPDWMDKHLNE